MTDINETKLTAYALGELDAAEAAKVESHLKADPDAQQTVDEIRSVAGLLQNELADEPTLELTDRHRSAIEAGRPKHVWRDRFIRAWPRVAAILVVGLTVAVVALALRPPLAMPPLARPIPSGGAGEPSGRDQAVLLALQPELRQDKHVVDASIPEGSELPWDDLSGGKDDGRGYFGLADSGIDPGTIVLGTDALGTELRAGEEGEFDSTLGWGITGLQADGRVTTVAGEYERGTPTGRNGRVAPAGLGDKGERYVTGTEYGLGERPPILGDIPIFGRFFTGSGDRTGGAHRGGEGSGRTVTGQTVEVAEKIKELRAGFRGGSRPADQGVESDSVVRRPATVDPRKVIYTATMRIATTEAELAVSRTRQLTEALGGYMQQMTKSAIIIRVPVTSFDAVLAQLAEMGTVVEQQIFGHDVTEEYVDLEIRLKTAKAMLTKLVELLDKATDVEKALMVEREIGRVQLAIDRIEGRLKLLANRTAYATITVNFIPAQHVPTTMKVRLPFSWLGELGVENLMKF
ncbi:hypothetical protein LCGC14_0162570 [marine sediment metagenome]|uniref:DUF4349 domain-containing protein n=1 Tax=marine sediment metagenome TaxID=412755 RepID=A0A0F9XD91_9ZZZZ|nr:DUF4349 domain-containing protein [Phycisphaerae bacterium]HDZ44270.1 DUF4349 domain-containing protein [Phycisphaerae bacterium]